MDDRNTKRVLTELARARKELKQLKERHHHLVNEDDDTSPPLNRSTGSSELDTTDTNATVEQTVLEIQEVHLISHDYFRTRGVSLSYHSWSETYSCYLNK